MRLLSALARCRGGVVLSVIFLVVLFSSEPLLGLSHAGVKKTVHRLFTMFLVFIFSSFFGVEDYQHSKCSIQDLPTQASFRVFGRLFRVVASKLRR